MRNLGYIRKCWVRLTGGPCLAGLLLFGVGPLPALSAETPRLPVVEVVAAPAEQQGTVAADPATGQSRLAGDALTDLPQGNSSVNGLLSTLPGVQTGELSRSSLQGGEILPPLISISGGKLEQNNFRIDGLGNNSLLDPLFDDPSQPNEIPGHPQELFLNSHLVESVTVYDHNVPARFGEFTGGVVDVVTRDPRPVLGGTLHLRTTRDEWTRFHLAAGDLESFEQSSSDVRQPRFRKYEGGSEFDLPLSPSSGLLMAVAVNYSEIPLNLLGTERDQSRRSDNYLFKLVHRPSLNEKVTFEALYAPYRENRFVKDTQGSGFSLFGNAGRVGVSYLNNLVADGELELHAGVRFDENARQAPANSFTWKVSPNKPWGDVIGKASSIEGGFGDLHMDQQTLESSLDWHSEWLAIGAWRHQVSAGVGGERAIGRYDRPQTSYAYRSAKLDTTVVCQVGDPACIDGEQWLSSRVVYQAAKVTANISKAYLYLEDRQQLGRLELRPGVRFSYDDFMENANLAPRFATSYDLFGNGATLLIGGLNRYYGQTLMTYKLREAITPTMTESRTTPEPNAWTPNAPVFPVQYNYSSLKTPYTDEVIVGLDQVLFGGVGKLRYIRRDGRDEFAHETDPFDATQRTKIRYDRMNNNGRSRYQSCRIDWQKNWVRQALDLNVTYQETTTTNTTYEDVLTLEELSMPVWYNGRLIPMEDLPRSDYNRGWVANLTYRLILPWHLQFTNVTSFHSGYRTLHLTSAMETVDGVDYPVYAELKAPTATTFDWRLDWQSPITSSQNLCLTLEIYNVFDRRNHVVDAGNPTAAEYALGRQFWAGAEYSF